ncbi:GMC oxidoreductase [Fomitopsis betulina]|nr:GMC oxidoreductase [Fomitopsis betulina]
MFASFPSVAIQNLAENYDYVVIERGGTQDSWISRIPLLSSHFASDGSRTRIWKATPQIHANGRVFEMAGGKSLGGSSRVNAMLYTRGIPAEYNSWSQAGRKGWSYDDMQPYFMKSETDLDQDPNEAPDFHGITREWQNRSHKQSVWGHTGPIIQASEAMGIPYIEDLNSPLHPSHGCAKMHFTIDSRGYRSSTYSACLPKELARERNEHLHICVRATVRKIEVETANDGHRTATGVYVQSADGRSSSRFVHVRKEAILTSGPVSSPQLLMLSGIGPAPHLRDLGILVVKDLPGVGMHLQDHLGVAVQYRVPIKDSVIQLQLRPWLIIKEFILYILFGTGLLLAPVLELSIFLQSRLFNDDFRTTTTSKIDEDASLPQNIPDIEVMPIAWRDIAAAQADNDGGIGFLCLPLRPKSTGTVRLASSDPFDEPVVDLNYLSSSRAGIACDADADLDAFIRRVCQTSYHYSSTCRMAPEGDGPRTGGVLDDRLRVHGVRGLRVADSSAFPHILSTHLAAATVALAEKCAGMIKDDNQGLNEGKLS